MTYRGLLGDSKERGGHRLANRRAACAHPLDWWAYQSRFPEVTLARLGPGYYLIALLRARPPSRGADAGSAC